MKNQKTRKIINLTSMLIFPITLNYFSPYLIIQGSFEGVLSGSSLLFLGLFLSSLFFGRAFCSWICPAGGLQEVCSNIVGKPIGRRINWIKYVIWIPWLAAIIIGFITAGGIKQINILYYTDYGISVSAPPGYIVYFSVILLIVILSLLLGRRAFCHCVCWMSPFMIIGSFLKDKMNIPSLRLRANNNECINCKLCNKHCPMSLSVNEMVIKKNMVNTECILCGNCVDSCPKSILHIGFNNNDLKIKL